MVCAQTYPRLAVRAQGVTVANGQESHSLEPVTVATADDHTAALGVCMNDFLLL